MSVLKIEHVGIMASDLEASIAFYTDVVGLEHLETMTLEFFQSTRGGHTA